MDVGAWRARERRTSAARFDSTLHPNRVKRVHPDRAMIDARHTTRTAGVE